MSGAITFKNNLVDTNGLPPDLAAMFSATRTLSDTQKAQVRSYYRRAYSPEYADLHDEMEKWREEESAVNRATSAGAEGLSRGSPNARAVNAARVAM